MMSCGCGRTGLLLQRSVADPGEQLTFTCPVCRRQSSTRLFPEMRSAARGDGGPLGRAVEAIDMDRIGASGINLGLKPPRGRTHSGRLIRRTPGNLGRPPVSRGRSMGGLWQDFRTRRCWARSPACSQSWSSRSRWASSDDGNFQRRLRRAGGRCRIPARTDHGRLRGQLEGPAVASGGSELRRLPRSEPASRRSPGTATTSCPSRGLRSPRGRTSRTCRRASWKVFRRPAGPRTGVRQRRHEEGGSHRPRQ